ncbi:MAG TPA: glycosyltransferase family 2 protein, partial [Candidatus Binataceae bacterium]
MNSQLSVVIPTYNRRRMLRNAISSVMAQRDAALELIIVDDGSTDGTREDLHSGELAQVIAAAPSNCRVDAVRTARRGPAAARNCGAALARSDYLAFLDSDDLWAPHKAGRQLAYMRTHPEFPLSQTQECWIRSGRRVNPGLRHKKQAGDIFEPSLRTCLISPSAVMMRTG